MAAHRFPLPSPRLFFSANHAPKQTPTMGSSDTPVTYNTSSQSSTGTPPSGGVFLKLVRSLSRSKSRSTQPPPPLVSPSLGTGQTESKLMERRLSRRESRSTPNGSSPGSSGRWLGQVGEAPGEFRIGSVACQFV